MTTTRAAKTERLRALHHAPPVLVLPNVWDVASARIVEEEGFPALATSSAGMAAAAGYPDGGIPPDEMLRAVGRIARAVAVPVTGDLEDGYGDTADEVRRVAEDAIAAGLAGVNIEDVRRDEESLVPVDEQVARLQAVREAGRRAGVPLVINARTDVFLRAIGDPAQRERVAVERGRAYREAGADCVFVPGVTDPEVIGRLCASIPGPVNVLAVAASPPLRVLERLGVSRVSLGSGPSRAALGWLRGFVTELRTGEGAFDGLRGAIPYDEVNAIMARRRG